MCCNVYGHFAYGIFYQFCPGDFPVTPPTGATAGPDPVLGGTWDEGMPWGSPLGELGPSLRGMRGIMGPPRDPIMEGDLVSVSEFRHSSVR